jgi:transposase
MSMRKIKEVLRLRFELQLGQREIARACAISQGAVHNYLKRAAAAGIGWPLPEGWDEKRIEETLFGDRHPIERRQRTLPNFPSLHEQLQQHRHLTLQLAWEEYRQVHPDGYGYSRFCELYGRWLRKQDVVLRQNYTPGEKGFVDWAGRTIPIQNPQTGEVHGAALFLMVLGASNYTYAEATLDQQLAAWLRCHIHAFEYFQAVPRLLVPDNTRTGVSRACRYDPDLNPTYQEMAMHYGVGVVPARPYHPRDKACVSYCTVSGLNSGQSRPGRSASSTPFDNRDTLERFVERMARANDAAQQAGPCPLVHSVFRNSQGTAHLFRCQQALVVQPAEPAPEVIDHTNLHDLL